MVLFSRLPRNQEQKTRIRGKIQVNILISITNNNNKNVKSKDLSIFHDSLIKRLIRMLINALERLNSQIFVTLTHGVLINILIKAPWLLLYSQIIILDFSMCYVINIKKTKNKYYLELK